EIIALRLDGGVFDHEALQNEDGRAGSFERGDVVIGWRRIRADRPSARRDARPAQVTLGSAAWCRKHRAAIAALSTRSRDAGWRPLLQKIAIHRQPSADHRCIDCEQSTTSR